MAGSQSQGGRTGGRGRTSGRMVTRGGGSGNNGGDEVYHGLIGYAPPSMYWGSHATTDGGRVAPNPRGSQNRGGRAGRGGGRASNQRGSRNQVGRSEQRAAGHQLNRVKQIFEDPSFL